MEIYPIIVIIVGVILLFIINYIRKKRIECPHCKIRGFSTRIDMISLGVNFRINHLQKYRVYYRCKKCDSQWSIIEEFDESGVS
jgi:hypothetical protein